MPCRERRIIPNKLIRDFSRQFKPFPFLLLVHISLPRTTRLFWAPILDRNKHAVWLLKIFVRITKACSRVVIRLSKITHSMRKRPTTARGNQPRQTILGGTAKCC